jgi:hypothetical protein
MNDGIRIFIYKELFGSPCHQIHARDELSHECIKSQQRKKKKKKKKKKRALGRIEGGATKI